MILLFAGPSLYGSRLAVPGHVALRPPAIAGDIARAIAERPQAIALVDGLFGTAPSVWHKEILAALDQGIAVVGAASLGALRAAELQPFGMEGVGAVFRACRDGHLVRDDAVLVSHAPAALHYRPLSVALVDAEDSIRRACLPPDDRSALLQIARRLPFYARTWATMLAAHPQGQRLEPLLAPHLSSRKTSDVEQLLQMLQRPVAPPPPGRRLRLTGYYTNMVRAVGADSQAASPARRQPSSSNA